MKSPIAALTLVGALAASSAGRRPKVKDNLHCSGPRERARHSLRAMPRGTPRHLRMIA